MRILVVGAGSTGGYFGGRLAQAGRDVTFLVRPARAARLRADGLRIVSPNGDATLHPALVTADQITAPFDVVLLAVKAFALDAALRDAAPAVGPATMIVPVLNGMRHMEAIAQRFGAAALLGGVCKVATTIDHEGRVVQLTRMHELTYGERDGRLSDRVGRLDATMQGAGFDARLSRSIEREMWEKWVMLASVGGITCLMRGTIGEVEAVPGGAAFALAFVAECAAVATASGQQPGDGFLADTMALVTQPGSGLASSMYRDLSQGHPVEVDQILGDLLDRAGRLGVPAPCLAAAFIHLSIYQRRLAG